MGLVLQLVETRADGGTRSVELMELGRPGNLRDIAELGLTLPEAKQLLACVQFESKGRSAGNDAIADLRGPIQRDAPTMTQTHDTAPETLRFGYGDTALGTIVVAE